MPKTGDKAAIGSKFAWLPIRVNLWQNRSKIVWLRTVYNIVIYCGTFPTGWWSHFGWSTIMDYEYNKQDFTSC